MTLLQGIYCSLLDLRNTVLHSILTLITAIYLSITNSVAYCYNVIATTVKQVLHVSYACTIGAGVNAFRWTVRAILEIIAAILAYWRRKAAAIFSLVTGVGHSCVECIDRGLSTLNARWSATLNSCIGSAERVYASAVLFRDRSLAPTLRLIAISVAVTILVGAALFSLVCGWNYYRGDTDAVERHCSLVVTAGLDAADYLYVEALELGRASVHRLCTASLAGGRLAWDVGAVCTDAAVSLSYRACNLIHQTVSLVYLLSYEAGTVVAKTAARAADITERGAVFAYPHARRACLKTAAAARFAGSELLNLSLDGATVLYEAGDHYGRLATVRGREWAAELVGLSGTLYRGGVELSTSALHYGWRFAVYLATDGRIAFFQHLDDIYTGSSSYRQLAKEAVLTAGQHSLTGSVWLFHEWFALTTDLGEVMCSAFKWSIVAVCDSATYVQEMAVMATTETQQFYELAYLTTTDFATRCQVFILRVHRKGRAFLENEVHDTTVELYSTLCTVYDILESHGGIAFKTIVDVVRTTYAFVEKWGTLILGGVARTLDVVLNRYGVHYLAEFTYWSGHCVTFTCHVVAKFLTKISGHLYDLCITSAVSGYQLVKVVMAAVEYGFASFVISTTVLFSAIGWLFENVLIRAYIALLNFYQEYQTQIFISFILTIGLSIKKILYSTPIIEDEYDGEFFNSSSSSSDTESDSEVKVTKLTNRKPQNKTRKSIKKEYFIPPILKTPNISTAGAGDGWLTDLSSDENMDFILDDSYTMPDAMISSEDSD